VNPGME